MSEAEPVKTVRLKLSMEYDVDRLVSLCPPEREDVRITTSRVEDCLDGREIRFGEVTSVDGIDFVGLDDAGVLIIQDGERMDCHFFSNGEKARIEMEGRILEICNSTDESPRLLVRGTPERIQD